ncbi:hypothetical protein J5U22_01798 [Saccharolobus shibatae]|uniref:Uncharacterized protein n=1 Tax=Saccharolobus shibatae TaxID=2286 RepID=A0A8F5GZM2_9CREN|nr:hypothetical protein J5U21_01878 [Saccharolobus shibatae]QXJ35251.1 hypothetical protein J5U22_01798 [Saccharolobus shibatae]
MNFCLNLLPLTIVGSVVLAVIMNFFVNDLRKKLNPRKKFYNLFEVK